MDDGKTIHFSVTRRALVGAVSCVCAVVVVLVSVAMVGYNRARDYRLLLESGYAQSLTGLASNLSGISAALNKGMYASTPVQISGLAAQLWRDSSAAKTSLAALPVGELHLDNTNRFLTQIGDYAMALCRKAVGGTQVSGDERAQFAAMCEYGRALSQQLYSMEQSIIGGQISMESIRKEIETRKDGAEPGAAVGAFEAMESSFADYEVLEYDGPFSDHILTRQSKMLQNAKAVTGDEAKRTAAKAAEVEYQALEDGAMEHSTMPAYTFSGENCWVNVTQQGGFVSYLIKSRMPGQATMSSESAVQAASDYLARMGLRQLVPTYYQAGDGVCTVNFAHTQGGALVYPDLIKVEVAMDNGEVLAYDARGYLANHCARTLETPKLTPEQAKAVVGDKLTVHSSRLAVIPTPGQYEAYCYELSGVAQSGEQVLVYVNTQTGAEEQILLLTQDDSGVWVR